MSRDVIAKIVLVEDQYEYILNLQVTFLPKNIYLTRISIISDLDADGSGNTDPKNIFAIYMQPFIDPLCEVLIDGESRMIVCDDQILNHGGQIGTSTTFRVIGLFTGALTSIGPNTSAAIALHLKFVE
jgi:hypothetical protein